MITGADRASIQPNARDARKDVSISVEGLIYVLLIIGAVAIRWVNLGAAPLTVGEASQAMAAWHMIAPASAPGTGTIDSILVFVGTMVSFSVSGPGNAAARFVAAFGGAALALTPLLFRNRLGRIGTMLCMLILAVSPSAVIDSRQMTGVGLSMLGMVGTLAAIDRYLTSMQRRYALIAGVALAVALLADFGSLAILVMLAAGAGLALLTDEEGEFTRDSLVSLLSKFPWSAALIGLATTTLLLGTLFYLAPNGLGAAADQVARFFGGLVARPVNTPYLGLVVFAYEPFLLVFGLIGAWFASQSIHLWQRFLAGWGIASIVISLLYPGAVPAHSLWCVVPLGALTALLLVELLPSIPDVPNWAIIAYAGGVVGLVAMIVGSLARQLSAPQLIPLDPGGFSIQFDVLLIAMWIVLGVVMWLTVASVWNRLAAWHGLGLGAAIAGLALSLGLSAAAAFTRPTSPFELFYQSPADPGLPLLIQTAQDISIIGAHDPHDATIMVQADPNGSLAWALRDFHNVQYVSNVPKSTQSVMVITPLEGTHPDLGSDYVGQSFVITRQWSVTSLDLPHFIEWLIYRDADPGSVALQRVILWVRSDVYQLVPKDSIAH